MVKVRGAQAKNQGGPSLFLKILHTKYIYIYFGTQGGPGPPLPSTWVRPCLVTNYNTLQGAKSHSQEKFLNHAFLHIILMMYHVCL